MSSVYDVFKELEREQQMQTAEGEETIDSNNYCMLESDTTRKILIPEKYSIFGVESDEKSNRIKFKFPQHVNDIDLSELSLRINYRNANGEIDQNLTENKETTDDRFVTFEWVLTRKVTAYMGDVDFIVCAIKTQPDGTITNEWNTTIATVQTLEGLEPEPVTEEETEQARDLLTQLLSVILSVKTDSVQAIDAKGAQVLESIPDDYTTLENRVDELELSGYNNILLPYIKKMSDRTNRNVKYVFDRERNVCIISGDVIENFSFCNIFVNENGFPSGLRPGEQFSLYTNVMYPKDAEYASNGLIGIQLYYYKEGALYSKSYSQLYNGRRVERYKIPEDVDGMIVRYFVDLRRMKINEIENFENVEVDVGIYIDVLSQQNEQLKLDVVVTSNVFKLNNDNSYEDEYGVHHVTLEHARSNGRWVLDESWVLIDGPNDGKNYTALEVVKFYSDVTSEKGNRFIRQTLSSLTALYKSYAVRYTDYSGMWRDWIIYDFDTSPYYGVNPNAKMLGYGNSILTGSVWKDGVYNHLAEYYNTPYGNIANAMGIPQFGVDYHLISSTGLLYDAGKGNFLTNIKSEDLTKYDVVLTHLWTSDMNSTYEMGDENSVSGDGSLAGAVLDLLSYIKSVNGNCQLVLIGIPPVNTTIYGEFVFTGKYENNHSIGECNELMHTLSEREKFVFIDWEGLDISYNYHDFTDGMNVHANNEVTYRIMGAYAGARVSNKLRF